MSFATTSLSNSLEEVEMVGGIGVSIKQPDQGEGEGLNCKDEFEAQAMQLDEDKQETTEGHKTVSECKRGEE